MFMDIQTILVASPLHTHMKEMIEKRGALTEFTMIYRDPESVTEEDVARADAFVAFTRPAHVDLSAFQWVHSLGAGVDKLMKDISWPDGVFLTRTVTTFGEKISEYVLSYLLVHTQKHRDFEALQKKKEWTFLPPEPLNTKRALIFGTGEIGSVLARTLAGLGVHVTGVSRSGEEKPSFDEVIFPDKASTALTNRLAAADLIVNTMPLTEETKGYFDGCFFEAAFDSLFINVGRGESVVDEDLLQALERGQLREAVLDVFSEEPLPKSHPFWEHPAVHITPHISAITTAEEGLDCFLDTVTKLKEGTPLTNEADPARGY
ncbi:D-isomer specific 2-hydroxyacid dehydrogenase NAD-binding protein [[Bacillus] selenitireducens MLS10]|uniref:D-isomer specific 2-hydroxyacid dehydrogenase NAD-binding protein n=2 Tax=Salisediminibacterium selenitireducens TaxID=85683 RepID=D6XZ74_BACIE|nr:D-isomer specific 2-hydroxyacid dehydrogenase NAD-binding protein [[Bacillus] selenitireducens MLS10]